MANPQSPLLRSREHLAIAQWYRPKRQERLITLRPSMAPFSRRPIRQPRIQRTTPPAPRSRTSSRKRIVRPPHNRILGRKPGTSPLSGHRLLRRASGRSPSAPLLLQKRGLRRSNNSARSPQRRSRKSRSRKRRSNRRKSQKKTRSRRSNDRVSARIKLGCNFLGILSFHRGALFYSP